MTEPGYTYFHYDKDVKSRTVVGGLGSITIVLFVSWIAISKGIEMIQFGGPHLLTVESSMEDEDKREKVMISETAKHWIEILEGSENDPLKTV